MEDVKLYAPICKIDKEKRLVYGFATTEALDQSDEIIDYEASKKAFSEWPGNIREMHQAKAVGTAIDIIPDDKKKGVFVVSRVSKGAQDTWEKVLDGTLKGYSIGGKVFKKEVDTVKINGVTKAVPRIIDYKLTELSLVDNPCNQECDVALVKSVDDSLEMTDVLESTKEVGDMDLEKKLKDFSQKWEDVQLLLTFEKLQSILRYVIEDIIYSDLSAEEKEKLLKKSLKQFQMKVEEMIPAASKLYSKLLDEGFYADILKKLNSEGGEDKVGKELEKKMDEVTEELKKSKDTPAEEPVKKADETPEVEKKETPKEDVAKADEGKEVEKKETTEVEKKEDTDVEKRFASLEKQIADLATLIKDSTKTEKSTEVEDLKKTVNDVKDSLEKFFGQPAERKAVVVEKEYAEEKKEETVEKKAAEDEVEKKAVEVERIVAKRKSGEQLTSDEQFTLNKYLDDSLKSKLQKLKRV